jgi:hypothetical protein
MKTQMDADNNIPICNYAGAFIDLLGQRERIDKFSRLPDMNDPVTRAEFMTTIKTTVGSLNSVRKLLTTYYSASDRATTFKNVPGSIRDEAKRLIRRDVHFQHFSDGILAYTPIANEILPVPQIGIYALMMSCGLLTLTSLAAESPIRGGLEIGWGIEYEPEHLFGSVVSRAYRLESEIAGYPRFVIGEQLHDYLLMHMKTQSHDTESDMRQRSSKLCLELLIADDDGYPVVDYLGKIFRSHLTTGFDRTTVLKAYSFVLSQSQKHKEMRNTKLAFRYSLLRNYFESRISDWNITQEDAEPAPPAGRGETPRP